MRNLFFCYLALFSFITIFSQEKAKKKDSKDFEFKEKLKKPQTPSRKYTLQEIQAIRNASHEQTNAGRYFGETTDEWKCIGPYNYLDSRTSKFNTGAVLDVEYKDHVDFHYRNIRILSANGGVFEKLGEKPWRNVTKNLTTNIGCFVTHPRDSNFIFVGTGDQRYSRSSGTGIYYSSDRGQTWTPSLMTDIPSKVRSIKFRPDNEGHMAAGSLNGFYLSSDDGTSWVKQDSFASSEITRVFVENTDYSVDAHYDNKAFYLSVKDRGLFKYREGIYEQINLPIPGLYIKHVELGFNPHNSNVVYALVHTEPYRAHAFRSTDHGNSWEPCVDQATANTFSTATHYFCNTIAINPADPQEVLFGNVIISRSVDGLNFNRINSGFEYHTDVSKIIPIPNELNAFWVACDGGLFKYITSSDSIDDSFNNIPIIENWDFEISRVTSEPIMVAATQDNATIFKRPSSSNWEQQPLTSILDGIAVGLNPYSNDTIMTFEGLTSAQSYLYYSLNGGALWQQDLDIHGQSVNYYFESSAHDYRRPTNFYYTVGNNIHSTNNFSTWTSTVFPFPPEVTFTPNIYSYVLSPSTTSPTQYVLLNSTTTDYLFVKRPTEPGVVNISNTTIEPGFKPNGIKCIYPRDNWFIAFTNHDPASMIFTNRRISFSQDYGMTFMPYAGNLPLYVKIKDVFINPYNSNIGIVATDFGPYITTDMGVTWTLWDLGLNYETNITELDYIDNVSYDGSITIVASTYGSSIWMRKLNAMAPPSGGSRESASKPVKEITIELMQPFIGQGGEMQVEYFMDGESEIEIDIYNAIGQKVRTVEKGIKAAGHYYSPVSVSGLSSGLYLVNLKTVDGKVITKKVVLN